jgi:hypothetical protein
MLGRSLLVGSVVLALVATGTGGCGSDSPSKGPAAAPQSLCARIGTDALRKVLPDFQPDPPGEGESAACVRLNSGSSGAPGASGGFLRITIENPTPSTDEECGNLEKEAADGGTWMGRDQLPSVGDFACGNVATEPGGGVVVTILSRRGATNVSVTHGRTPGDVATVREAAVDLARTVMRRV